ncbi:uncharacterized protein LOC115666213 [Syzygium oleosum]|uniref:uncharacterized protein LOC115666213 n=1 Tax=Syzygium oleosum TaxID=219896 RepID=UPI0024B888A6|nr:uncharacterized protein LOC115666213 [Syzygium oleosum]
MSSDSNAEKDPRLERILQVLANVGSLMEKQELQRAASSSGNGERRLQGLIEQFLKLKPPRFAGTKNPEETKSWIDEMEKIVNLLDCNDTDKIALAEYQLQENAIHWWKASKETMISTDTIVTWDGFVKAFFWKYFSDYARDRKIMEFMQLKQNNLTVDQYEAKFTELSRFAPKLVEDREDKAKRFWDDLRSNIRNKLVPLNLKDYNELYEHARFVEKKRFGGVSRDNTDFPGAT